MSNQRFSSGYGGSPIAGAMMRVLAEGGELSVPALRALSPLPDKAQVLVDQAVVEVGVERLVFAQDLMMAGLTMNLTDPLSVPEVEWEAINKVGTAIRAMSPSARGENQMPDRTIHRVPIYLTMDDFSIGIRMLKVSQRIGQPLDLSLVKQATRAVNESVEDACINGATTMDGVALKVGSYDAPGLVNAPNANTGNTTSDWTVAGAVGTQGPAIVADVLAAITALQADKKFGPYTLYVGTKAGNVIENDFKANTMGTIRQRLEQINAGGRTLIVRVADRMPAGTGSGDVQFALVQMTDDVVQLINGQAPTVIPWTSADGFTLFWLVMAIQVPRIRSDYNGNSGVYLGKKV